MSSVSPDSTVPETTESRPRRVSARISEGWKNKQDVVKQLFSPTPTDRKRSRSRSTPQSPTSTSTLDYEKINDKLFPKLDNWKTWDTVFLTILNERNKVDLPTTNASLASDWELAFETIKCLRNDYIAKLSGSGKSGRSSATKKNSTLGHNSGMDSPTSTQPPSPMEWSALLKFLSEEKEKFGLTKDEKEKWNLAVDTMTSLRIIYEKDVPEEKKARLDFTTPIEEAIMRRRGADLKRMEGSIKLLEGTVALERLNSERIQKQIADMLMESQKVKAEAANLEENNKSLEGRLKALEASSGTVLNCLNPVAPNMADVWSTSDSFFSISNSDLFKDTLPETFNNYVKRTLVMDSPRVKIERRSSAKKEQQVRFTEEEFLGKVDTFAQKIFYIYGDKDSGKASFLVDIGRQLEQKSTQQRKYIGFFSCTDFMHEFKSGDITDKKKAVTRTLLNLLCQNQLGQRALQTTLEQDSNRVYLELMLHHVDSLSSEDLELVHVVMSELVRLYKSVRIWITSRLESNSANSGVMDCVKLKILPFSKEDLIESLVQYWKKKFETLGPKTITRFAQTLLQNLNVTEVEQFVSIPLQYEMIREGYEKQLLKHAESGITLTLSSDAANSITEFFNAFAIRKMKKYEECNEGQSGLLSSSQQWTIHHRLCFQTLFLTQFPAIREMFYYHDNPGPDVDIEAEILKVGLVTKAQIPPIFIHPSICQYFVAQYTCVWMTRKMPEDWIDKAVECNLLDFYFNTVFAVGPDGNPQHEELMKMLDYMMEVELRDKKHIIGELLNDCPNIGYETIREFLVNCKKFKWHNLLKIFSETNAVMNHYGKLKKFL